MTGNLKKTSLILLTLLLTLIFAIGCSCSTESNQNPSTENPVSEESGTENEGNEDADASVDPSAEDEEPAETPSDNEPVVFEEPVFLELIKKELGKEEIYPSDLEKYINIKITADEFIFLSAAGETEKSIIHFNEDAFEYEDVRYEGFGTLRSLADLKHFKNLDKLYITLQPEIDYDTLPENVLKTVRIFNLYQSQVEDIGFLEKFENLISLNLNTNNISDLSPLKDKTALIYLYFNWNTVEDLS
jgi:Leucine-rich repeat (LRR) protein